MAGEALAGRSGMNLRGYRDYRGVPVIGAWKWDENYRFGIATEIDVSEAFAPMLRQRDMMLTGIVLTDVLILVMTLLFLRNRRQMARANRELQQVFAQANSILENATDGILTVDEQQRVLGFNPACEQMWGYKADEVMGREMTMLLPEYIRSEHIHHVHRFRDADSQGIHMESRGLALAGLTKDGVVFPAEVGISKNVVNGEVTFSAFIKDVTERQKAEQALREAKDQAERAEARSRLLLESASDGIYGVDLEGRITFVNPAVMDLLGYSREELMHQQAHAVFHHSRPDGTDYPIEECPMRAAFTDGVYSLVDDECLWRKDGQPIDVEYTAVPMRQDKELVGAVVVSRRMPLRPREISWPT
jgi:PAS domain S-box-containing protein